MSPSGTPKLGRPKLGQNPTQTQAIKVDYSDGQALINLLRTAHSNPWSSAPKLTSRTLHFIREIARSFHPIDLQALLSLFTAQLELSLPHYLRLPTPFPPEPVYDVEDISPDLHQSLPPNGSVPAVDRPEAQPDLRDLLEYMESA
jgi:hypothetical protein